MNCDRTKWMDLKDSWKLLSTIHQNLFLLVTAWKRHIAVLQEKHTDYLFVEISDDVDSFVCIRSRFTSSFSIKRFLKVWSSYNSCREKLCKMAFKALFFWDIWLKSQTFIIFWCERVFKLRAVFLVNYANCIPHILLLNCHQKNIRVTRKIRS